MTLRAQGQAVDGPDDVVSFTCTRRSSTSLRKIIPTDIRDLGCSMVAWPEQRPPALRSSSSAAPAAFANKNTFFRRQSDLGCNPPGAPSHAPLLWPPPGTCFSASGRRPPRPRHPRVPTARHPEPPRWPNQRLIWPQTAQGGLGMPSDALAAPQMPPISEIRPRGGTHKSVEGRWTHHVRCFFVPLTHRPDVCGWFGRWGRLGLRHLGVPLVSARRGRWGRWSTGPCVRTRNGGWQPAI